MSDNRAEGERQLAAVRSDAFYRSVVDQALSPFIVVDADLRLLYASSSIEQLTGWQPEDWLGRSVADLLTPESLEVAAAGIGDLFEGTNDPEFLGGPVRLYVRCADQTLKVFDAESSPPERTGVADRKSVV
jgi:PAS domain-containing protein